MKWTYIIENKLKASFLLFIVLLVVLLNNIKERNESEEINGLVTSIYEDRLVVEKFNYNLLNNMHKIISLTNDTKRGPDKNTELKSIIQDTEHILLDYRNTYLTKEEEKNLNDISHLNSRLNLSVNKNDYPTCNKMAAGSLPILNELSSIQISEGRAIKTDADKLFSSSKISSEFEFAMIIIIGFIIQALVYSSRTMDTTSKPHQLN